MRAVIGKAVKPRIDLNAEIEPAVYARLFLECLAEEGVSASEVLAGTGLSPVDLAEYEKLISIAQQIRIYANIAQLSDNPTVGLSQGQKILPHHHGVWGYAMQTSANLGQAIRVFNQYFDVAGPIARQFLQVNGTVARWVSTDVLPTEPARRVAVEEMLAGNLTLFKHLSDGKFRLKALHLDYARPEGHTAYDELFQCPVLFDQDTIEMRFNASLLNLKLKYADADTKRV